MKKQLILFIVLGLLFAGPAYADLFGFYNITNNNATDAAIGEAQLSVDVSPYPGFANDVGFMFLNTGSEASSITQIYFDDDSFSLDVAAIASIEHGEGVSFHWGATPSNLPAGETVDFTANISAGANAPAPSNGVNADPNFMTTEEYLTLWFSPLDGISFDDVLENIESGALRIGIHVQGFESGGSESFVTYYNTNPVPEPATMLLLGSGLIGFAVVGRRKFFKK